MSTNVDKFAEDLNTAAVKATEKPVCIPPSLAEKLAKTETMSLEEFDKLMSN